MTLLRYLAMMAASSIVAVWIVYPLIIGLLARWYRPRRGVAELHAHARAPTVSVVIATRDEPALVRERIADCLGGVEDPTRLEIVIGVDFRAVPEAYRELSIAPNVVVVRGDPPGGKATALNAAVRAARGDVLLFTDVQQRFERDAISRLVPAFDRPEVGAVSGRLELAVEARRSPVGRYWSYERWLRRCEADVHSCVGATGAIWALRRALWSPLPPALINDDLYGPMRVVLSGYRVAFADDARAVDLRRAASSSEYHRKVRTLTGIIQLCAWLPQVLVPTRNPIWLQFVFHKLLRLLTPYWLLAILVWCAVVALREMGRHPAMIALAALVAALVAIMARVSAFRLLRRLALWGLKLQAAIVVATVNGFRRRWDVWHT